jgi:non-homologous end joining protein Ku
MIENGYYVAPDNNNKNDKADSLLVKGLTETKKIVVGKVVFKDKEHIVALRPISTIQISLFAKKLYTKS